MSTMHTQVVFKTLSGLPTKVDEGLFDVLTALRDHGVKSLWSCEGTDDMAAYISMQTKTALPFIKKIRRAYKAGELSQEASFFVGAMMSGFRERSFSHFQEEFAAIRLAKGHKLRGGYFAFERSWSPKYRGRICIRFPREYISTLEELLLAID